MSNFSLINLTFGTVNCNSLNMSNSAGSIQKRKIFGITKLRCDIIFLSDLRLGNRNLTNNIDELKKFFRVNPYGSYKLLYHSTKNKRGVGILVKSDLDFSELQRVVDTDENCLAVKASIEGRVIILCSIYGPNIHDPAFFINMFNAINQLGNFPKILAGDWNCTYSSANITVNLDCYNMLDLPNKRHSDYLEQFCEDLGIQDPYRALNPVRREYTYSPFGILRENRSRIDFFLVSNSLIPHISTCEIAHCPSK
jgi:exonuclease III